MNRRDIAVVGMACVFPEAADLRSYWRNIVNGVDAIRTLPEERWPGSRNTELPPDHFAHIGCTRGGFIPTPFLFEPLRFKVMPKVAQDGDVDQFILLQILGDALADAGIGPGHPLRERADIIVGRGGYTSNKMMEIFLRADLIDRLQRYLARRLPQLRPADLDALVEDMKGALPEADVDGMATSIPNLVASRAANRLDLQGTAYTVDAACASSLIAVEQAMRRLREGLCDVALACGVNFTHVPSFWYLFGQILAVSPSGRIRPFDRNADGMLIGEGAGAVVLKRLEDAVRDGDRVYALVKGAGSASDGGDTGLLAPSSRGQIKALKMGHADAGIEPGTIGLLEAHGTGTVQGDACELESIRAVFGERSGGHATRVVGSVKSMIGHAMPAAGIASFIKATLALTNKILPPSLHCDQPHPGLDGLPFFATPTARPWVQPTDDPPRRAGINAFGFGGINSHVVLEEVRAQERKADRRAILATPGMIVASGTDLSHVAGATRPADTTEDLAAVILEPSALEGVHDGPLAREPEPSLRRPSELLVFSAPSVPDLAARVRRAAAFAQADRTGHTLEDLAFSLATEMDGDLPCRLAVVVEEENGGEIAGRLEDLAGKLEEDEIKTDDTAGVFFSTDAQRPAGKLAALFPGLGFPGLVGHYPDHLTALCLHLPVARSVFDQVEARDRHPEDPLPTSFLLQPPDHLPAEERNLFRQRFTVTLRDPDEPVEKMDPARRYLSGVGMLASNWAGWQILEGLDLPVDMLCGQSLGDISAMCAAHMVDFEEVIPRLWNYLDEDYRLPGTGCMAFVGASEERIAKYLERFEDVCVALHQSPETLVLGGSDESIIALVRLLKEENILAQRLPIPPVHTPRMDHKQQEFVEKEGSPVPLRRPRTTVYSPITSSPMPDDAGEYRALIASNMTQPVRFWQTLRRMYDDGARIFIQVGTGTLAGNIRSILPEEDVTTVALDVDYRHPLTQLQHLCGRLLASGVRLDPTGLFEARRPRRLDLDTPGAEAGKPRGAIPLTLYWPPLHTDEAPLRSEPSTPKTVEETPSAALPFIGAVTEFVPQQRIDFVRRFRLDEDLYLEDHHFINCREHKPLEDCFPVVPLTVTLETLAEAAACLAPGMGLIGFEEIRAKRWIALDGVDHLDVRVQAEVVSAEDGILRVRGKVFTGETAVAEAVVRMSSQYRQTVDLRFSELANPGPLALETRRLYDDRHLFHGRRFQCIETITQRGDQGITGELVVPDYGDFLRSTSSPQLLLDPVVLDGAGQMLCPLFVGQAIYMLPVAVEKIEFYRPAPPAGTRVPVRLEVVELDPDQRKLVANMEVQDGEGGVWFRVIGWQDIVFRYPRPLLETQQHPTETTIAREPALSGLPDGGLAVALQRDDLRDAQPERLAQLYLSRDEMDPFRSLAGDPRRQRQWLMGRIAAKDAARLWLARTSGEPMLHPVQLTIGNDERGRPFVRLPAEGGSGSSGSEGGPAAPADGASISDAPGPASRQAPAVSIAHTAAIAVAVASPGPAGIDVEAVDAGSRLTLEDFAADSEIALLAEAGGGEIQTAWVTRLWCAKEAAAKLLGGGLQGRPKALQAIRIDPGGRLLMQTVDSPGTIEIHIGEMNGSLIAVARPAALATEDRAAGEAHLS